MSELKTNCLRLFGMIIDKGRNLGAVGQTAGRAVFSGLRKNYYSCFLELCNARGLYLPTSVLQ